MVHRNVYTYRTGLLLLHNIGLLSRPIIIWVCFCVNSSSHRVLQMLRTCHAIAVSDGGWRSGRSGSTVHSADDKSKFCNCINLTVHGHTFQNCRCFAIFEFLCTTCPRLFTCVLMTQFHKANVWMRTNPNRHSFPIAYHRIGYNDVLLVGCHFGIKSAQPQATKIVLKC